MARHEAGPHCPSCNEKLKEAHPTLDTWFRLIKVSFPECHISWSYRNERDQNLFFQNKKSKAKYPHSPHNKTNEQGLPCARAIDLFELLNDRTAAHKEPYFKSISDFLKVRGAPIEWGGDWKMKDGPHFQLTSEVKQDLNKC